MKKIPVWILSLIIIFLSAFTSSISQENLKVMVIFAHPDEGEIYAGGITALYVKMGHEVKFMSLTNGDAGHYSMKPEDLAKRRNSEAMNAKEILGLSEYEILEYHDGILKNSKDVQEKVIKSIREWEADIVFTFYPAEGGHNDNMNTGWIVREASTRLNLEKKPVFIYMRDFHTASLSYIPDLAIDIDEVWKTKLAACGAHESQVIEYNPEMEGVLEEVLASKDKQDEFLFHNTIPFSVVRPDNLLAVEKWYGKEIAKDITYVEEFEIAEYGRQINEKEVMRLFPMIGKAFTISGKTEWFDTGVDVEEGQILEISSDGKIIWNLKEKKYCDPDGAIPYTRWGDKPLLGVGTGALIGKIGDNSSDSFFIGKEQELHVYQSGRLYLGINDDNTADNEGLFRARIRMIK